MGCCHLQYVCCNCCCSLTNGVRFVLFVNMIWLFGDILIWYLRFAQPEWWPSFMYEIGLETKIHLYV